MTRLPIEHGDTGALAREKINNSRTRLLQDIQEMQPKIINKTRWIGNTNTGISAEGKGLTLRVDEGKIQYQVEWGSVWVDLIEISALKGERGEPFRFEDFSPEQLLTLKGEQGKDGVSITAITKSKSWRTTTIIIHKSDRSHQSFTVEDGVGIENITNNSLNGVNTITIHKTDGSTHKFNIYDGADGEDGADGKNPEFNLWDNHIQRRLQWAEERINLIPLSLIQGAQGIQWPQGNKGDQGNPGKNPEFNLWDTHIQRRLQGESQRKNLIPLTLITWPAGSGTGDMLKSENLAGLTDKQQARTNLEVYSKAEVDEQVNSSKHIEVNVETAWNVQHKVGSTAQGHYVPQKWDIFLVNFVHGTVVSRPTLNIDWSGAKAIRAGYYDVGTNMLNLNKTANSNIKVFLRYDGSHYQMFGAGHNSTYGEIPEAEISNATLATGRLVSGRRLVKIKEHFERNVPDPSAPNHSANKKYVDEKVTSVSVPDVSGLATKTELIQGLQGKADTNHSHQFDEINGLLTALNSKSNTDHIHSINGVSGLQNALNAKQSISQKNQAHGYVGLDANKKIDPALLPVIATVETVVVANKPARLALTTTQVQKGDCVVQSDNGERWVLSGTTPGIESHWTLVADITPEWSQIANKPTAYTPASHTHTKDQVGLGNVDNTSDATKNTATATLTNKTINGDDNTITKVNSIKNLNGNAELKVWAGTQQQYDVITPKDANTLYLIKDN